MENERDELFEDAAKLVVETQVGSTSMLQRRMKLGYMRATRILNDLETAGIVGPEKGAKPREVKVKDKFELAILLTALDNTP